MAYRLRDVEVLALYYQQKKKEKTWTKCVHLKTGTLSVYHVNIDIRMDRPTL